MAVEDVADGRVYGLICCEVADVAVVGPDGFGQLCQSGLPQVPRNAGFEDDEETGRRIVRAGDDVGVVSAYVDCERGPGGMLADREDRLENSRSTSWGQNERRVVWGLGDPLW